MFLFFLGNNEGRALFLYATILKKGEMKKMVKRIQQVLIVILILALLPFSAYAANDDSNYTSLYYSDTQELEEVRIIDSLYEYGLMDGIIQPTDEERGIFIANDYVTIH